MREIINGKLKCSLCHLFKPPEDFTSDKLRKFGLSYMCRSCAAVYRKETKNTERQRDRYHNDPVVREKHITNSTSWAKKNPEKIAAIQRKAYLKRKAKRSIDSVD